jgi:hypothetical protein
MNSSALFTMVVTMSLITGLTIYFIYRVLTTPPKQDEPEE